MRPTRSSAAWLLAFAVAIVIGVSAGGSTEDVWVGLLAGLVPLWITAVAFALSADRTDLMARNERRAAETRDALDVLRAELRDG